MQRLSLRFALNGVIILMMALCSLAEADVFLRVNLLGYTPERPKTAVVMSEKPLSKQRWQLQSLAGDEVLSGRLAESVYGVGDHTSFPYNYVIDFSGLTAPGLYQLQVAGQAADIRVSAVAYATLPEDILRHLRVARSGTQDTLIHKASHLGDAAAPIYRPKGELKLGVWEPEPSGRTVDMRGGWYDAGDYIKFTLTTAYTSYYLLRAYQENPALYSRRYSQSEWLDIIDEAHHGLEYLYKTYPSEDTFVIQVSTGDDHKQGYRLPENDKRDGKREALAAISPAHMGLTAAALALGADVFAELGESKLAQRYRQQAEAIYTRARQPDALAQPAFERDQTNDFYRDNSADDNMGLAAIELYRHTQDAKYLEQAKAYSKRAKSGGWASWCCVTASLNYRLQPYSDTAAGYFQQELQGYLDFDRAKGNLWTAPMPMTWAPLPGAFVAASYAGLTDPQSPLLWNTLDYLLGRNNWGVAMIASPSVSPSVNNIYTQIYSLSGEFPLGAIAEGPGGRATYEALQHLFKPHASDARFEPFNTRAYVFYDNPANFQTMETVIIGQATALYMLSVINQ